MLNRTHIRHEADCTPWVPLIRLRKGPAVRSAAAVGIATINSVGNQGGFIGSSLVGALVQTPGTTGAGLVAIGACLASCGLLTLAVRVQKQGT